jgi:hypothetical protein
LNTNYEFGGDENNDSKNEYFNELDDEDNDDVLNVTEDRMGSNLYVF